MIELNKNKIQFKYLVGLNKTLKDYPTPLDILYDSCLESLDDTFFSDAKLENKYNLTDKQIEDVHNFLIEHKYIEKKIKNYKIVNTPWS